MAFSGDAPIPNHQHGQEFFKFLQVNRLRLSFRFGVAILTFMVIVTAVSVLANYAEVESQTDSSTPFSE